MKADTRPLSRPAYRLNPGALGRPAPDLARIGPMGVDHYENFPVASLLCPPKVRPAVVAIYHFARTADDLADEGGAPAERRLQELARYRAELVRACAMPMSMRPSAEPDAWPRVFEPLARQIRAFALPPALLHLLLDAFEQDVRNPVYPDRATLLEYCRRSANPVGRLLLHLYGIDQAASLAKADAICSALQLINFWQDMSVDAPRARHYTPEADRQRHGVTREELQGGQDSPRVRALVADLCDWARELMQRGAPLAHELPGRAGWELRLVVQGGLRILEKIRRMDHATLRHRPRLYAPFDLPTLLWRAWRMRDAPAPDARRVAP
jgi:squalene synthase HpnC